MIEKIFMPDQGNSIGKTYFWTVLAGLIYAGSSFVMSMAVSNLLGVYAFGIFTIAMSIGNQLLTIGYYNVRTFHASDVEEKHSFGDYLTVRMITVGVMLLAGAVWVINKGYGGVELAVILLTIMFKAQEAVSDLFEGRYQQKGRYDVSCRGVFVKTTLYLLCFIGMMYFTRSLLWSFAVLSGVYLLSIIVIDGTLIKKFGTLRVRFDRSSQIKLLQSCFPLFINSFLSTYILSAAKYAIDSYYGKTVLGTFNALYMMAFIINLFANFVFKPLISPLSVRYLKGDQKGFVNIIRRQLLLIGGITIVCVLGAYLLGVPILSWVFSVDLSPYRMALCIILIGGAFTAVYQLLQCGIIIMRHQYSCFIGCAVTALLTFFITPELTRRYAINGAALGFLCSMVLISLIFLAFLIYYLKKDRQNAADS